MSDGKFIVGVIGAQNTGKSTFIKDLIEKFKDTDHPFITVGCDYRKKISEAGLKYNRNGNKESQTIIQDTLIEQLEIIKGMPSGNYITDRSPMDSLAYSVYLYRHNPEAGFTGDDIAEHLAKVKESIKAYDRLYFIDLDNCDDVKVVDDKFRDTNPEYRSEINQIFKEIFGWIGSDILDSRLSDKIYGSREERIGKFMWIDMDKMVNVER